MKVEVRTESIEFEGNEWVSAGTRWNCSIIPNLTEIKGCPLGRGSTEQEAIADLIRRVRYESNLTIIPEVTERCRY